MISFCCCSSCQRRNRSGGARGGRSMSFSASVSSSSFSSFSLLRYLKAQWHFNCLWLHKAQRRLRVFVSLFGRAVTCSRNLWLRLVAWVTGAAFPVYSCCCCCRLRRPLAAPKGGSNRVCFVLSALWLKFNFIYTAHMYACVWLCVCVFVCVCSCGDWQIAVGGMGAG